MIDFDNQSVGKRIKELRLEFALSQRALAEQIGVAQNTIAQYEAGTAKPSIEVVVRMAEVLQTTTDYILRGIM